ncbi:MAG: hypothetical protein ACYCUG_06845 [Acidimicrobiales bacterium]
MERDGLIAREAGTAVRSDIVYRTTPLADSLSEPVQALLAWEASLWDEVSVPACGGTTHELRTSPVGAASNCRRRLYPHAAR